MVISIIGILVALSLTGFNAARKNARDAERKSDLQQYRVALEGYASNQGGVYPSVDGNSQGVGTSIFDTNAANNPIVIEYLPSVIEDPVDTTTYYYIYDYYLTTGAPSYSLRAPLETGGYWEICSNGKSCKLAAPPAYEACRCP